VIDRVPPAAAVRFRDEYAAHRAAEGRQYRPDQLLELPYLTDGPLARQWQVRARTFDAFVRHVLTPAAAKRRRPLDLLDLGAGNAWLCYRAALAGHRAVAVDIRLDTVDGLGAAAPYVARAARRRIQRIAASFDALPLAAASFDVVVFNAALHYAIDLTAVLAEASRVTRSGGAMAILDSPCYGAMSDGEAMVAEKHRDAQQRFGTRADALLALPFVEFLTRERLTAASCGLGLRWQRRRVRYPLWYELRPLVAWLRRRRKPSRFDLWESVAP
jgi:SAM-dependent methyltransferase